MISNIDYACNNSLILTNFHSMYTNNIQDMKFDVNCSNNLINKYSKKMTISMFDMSNLCISLLKLVTILLRDNDNINKSELHELYNNILSMYTSQLNTIVKQTQNKIPKKSHNKSRYNRNL
jgi:hypothetical protein